MECFKNYISPDGNGGVGAKANQPRDDETCGFDDWPATDERDNVDESCEDLDDASPLDNDGTVEDVSECASMFQEVLEQHLHPVAEDASRDELWKQLCTLNSDFNRYSLNICLQQHRSLRFKNMGLFEANRQDTRDMDVWDFISINSDVAICLVVHGKYVWRLGNVENIRKLKIVPKPNTNLSGCETESYPPKVLLNDEKCAFHVRYYRECSVHADILDGFQNDSHACLWKANCAKKCKEHKLESCHKCCKEPIEGRTFYLPNNDERTLANEPVMEIPACIVLDTVSMVKIDTHRNLWLLGCGNKELVLKKFKVAGGLVPLPDGKGVKKKAVKIVKKAHRHVRKVATKNNSTPNFHALDQDMHQRPLQDLIGCSIHVYWPVESSWFVGVVTKFHPDAVNMQVLYIEDSDKKYHDLGPGGCIWGLHLPHKPLQPVDLEEHVLCSAAHNDHDGVSPEIVEDMVTTILPETTHEKLDQPLGGINHDKGSITPRDQPIFHIDNEQWHHRQPSDLIGLKVNVYWPVECMWYKGTINMIHPNGLSLQVEYEDGDKRYHNFGPCGDDWGVCVDGVQNTRHNLALIDTMRPKRGCQPHKLKQTCHTSNPTPDFDRCNSQAHRLKPDELIGFTMHIHSGIENHWRLGKVTHVRHVDSWLCVQYNDGTASHHNFSDPGATTWGVARMHAVLESTLNVHGQKSWNQLRNEGHPDDRVVDMVMRHGKKASPGLLTRSEMQCFGPGSWLTGDALGMSMNALCVNDMCSPLKQNFYSRLVQSSHLRSNHRGADYTDDIKKWFRQTSYMWTQHKLFVIVHINCSNDGGPWEIAPPNHWLLAVIDLHNKIFRYHDPMGSSGREAIFLDQRKQCIRNLKMWLTSEHDMEWVASAQVDTQQLFPTQGNGFDCGLYTILYAWCEAKSVPLSELPFGQQHCAQLREHIIAALVQDDRK